MKDKISYILLVLLALGPFNADCLSFLKNKLAEGDPLSLTSDPESDSRKEVSDSFLSFELNNPLKSPEKESDSLLSFELNNPLKSRDDCDYPKQTGYCFASKKRFYFNGETCEVFTYGGCGGNRNNFKTKEKCMKKCSHKLDIGSGVAEDEDEMFLISFP